MASTLTYVVLMALAFCAVACLATEICREAGIKPGWTVLLSQAVLFATTMTVAGWSTALMVAGVQVLMVLTAMWIRRQSESPSPSALYRLL